MIFLHTTSTKALIILFFLTITTITTISTNAQPFDLTYYGESTDCYTNNNHNHNNNYNNNYINHNAPQQCQPNFINVAYNRLFAASNTCANNEEFCVQGNSGSFCDFCRSDLYSAQHLTDALNHTWWQSGTMLKGLQYPNSVNLTLDLGKSYHITYIRLKFQSLRPESFAIYKRNDPNEAWTAFQYYSSSCYETYGVRENETLSRTRQDVAICDSKHTDTLPTSGGTVAFSTLQGRPSARDFKSNPALQDWVTATQIKIILNRMNTFGDEVFKDPTVLKSYFYAISDIAIGGRCNCNGHASRCEEGRCQCEHHTTGTDCQECLPLYNGKPWSKATGQDAHECLKCNCNGLSNKCYFDQDLYARSGDGGHCVECGHNRFGAHCELCAEGYYTFSPEDHCRPCDCNQMGSRTQECDARGVCACKEGVTGDKCDRCLPNFYGLSPHGCKACECSVAGSLENRPECVEGRCRCKENVQGDNCHVCKKGYFGLNAEDPLGCMLCHCNGHSNLCHAATPYTISTISTHFGHGDGRWTGIGENGEVIPVLVSDQSIQVSSSRDAYLIAPTEYLGDKQLSYNLELSFTLRDHNNHRPSHNDIIIESTNGRQVFVSFSAQNNPAPSQATQSYSFKLNEHPFYEWRPSMRHQEFIDLLSEVTAIKIKANGYLGDFKLQTATRGYGPQTAYNVERCECPEGYVGQFCESCSPGFRRQGGGMDGGRPCVPCNCNGHSDACDPASGRCICSHNTVGESCERCAPGFYGNALNGRRDDCRECPCPNRGQCEMMGGGEVVCKECMPGYAGNRCDECADGYHGDPQGVRGGRRACEECNCNGNIDPNVPGNCDKWTGECLKCIYNTGGSNCDRCLPNHHGNPVSLPRGQCKPCECYMEGSMVDERGDSCNTYTGQCICKHNVIGPICDRCAEGFWNIHSPHGCERCNCDREGSMETTCDPQSGQCRCKTGVQGLKCDTCLPNHYGFCHQGCTACECNTEGSLSRQCDPVTGQCMCRESIEGRVCDRCAMNRYLDARGQCVECPECYKLVQTLGDDLKQKLNEMRVFVNYLLHDPSHHNHHHNDHAFTSTMYHLNSTLVNLWMKIKHYRGGHSGGTTTDDISRMQASLYELVRSINTIQVTIESSAMRCNAGAEDLSTGISLMNSMNEILSSSEQKFERGGLVTLRIIYETQKRHGSQSQTLTRIAHQARTIVEELEMTSEKIEQVTNEALRKSEEALRLAQQSQATPGDVVTEINKIKIKLQLLHQQHQQTRTAAEASKHEAMKAYNQALQLLTIINSLHLPTHHSHHGDDDKFEAELRRIRIETERLERDVAELVRKNTKIINGLKHRLRMARDTYKRAIREQQVLDEMLAEIDSARVRAMGAVDGANEAYHRAQQDLLTLQQFDDKVQKSKRFAQEAMHRKDMIMAKVKEAEEMTRRAKQKLANADQDAMASKRAIDEASNTIQKTFQLLENLTNMTDLTKEELLNINKLSIKIKVQLDEIIATMNAAERTIAEDERRIQIAKEDSDIAKSRTSIASNNLMQYRRQFEKMIRELGMMEDYDPMRVENLERRMVTMERVFGGDGMFQHIHGMQQINLRMNIIMDDYEAQMGQLRLDVLNIQAINATIPRKCHKTLNLEPTDPRVYI